MSVQEKTSVHVRWMIRRDMPDVLNMEWQSAEALWQEEDFITALRQRNCIGMVAVDELDRPCGCIVYELQKSKIFILNLLVAEDQRRRGIGTALIEKLKGKLSLDKRKALIMDVRDSNLTGHLFLRANEFEAKHVAREYFVDVYQGKERREDGYRFIFTTENDNSDSKNVFRGV